MDYYGRNELGAYSVSTPEGNRSLDSLSQATHYMRDYAQAVAERVGGHVELLKNKHNGAAAAVVRKGRKYITHANMWPLA